MRRTARIIIPLLLLASCGDAPRDTAGDNPPPSPLVYEIASADGIAEGWLIGTIHALPSGTQWRTPAIARIIDEADLLVVEIAGLENGSAIASTFAALARTRGQPLLAERLPPDLRPQLETLIERGSLNEASFADTETWAAAIALARVDATGDPANGVDRALIEAFSGRPVRELEGAPAQLAIFDRLTEAQQRTMLASVVRESERTRKDPTRLQRAWLAGDSVVIEQSTQEGFLADPVLREALLTGRNRRWASALAPVLAKAPRPLIAVGTAHLVGPDGLAALLAAQGYRIRRLSPP
ncbi:MAG: TraB/GumN family protein [Erythrobacter sp.]